jgi:hypothetical protein
MMIALVGFSCQISGLPDFLSLCRVDVISHTQQLKIDYCMICDQYQSIVVVEDENNKKQSSL